MTNGRNGRGVKAASETSIEISFQYKGLTRTNTTVGPVFLTFTLLMGMSRIPISEVAAKDDSFNIKNVTRDDVLAAHRVPPPLMGIVPGNTGGFGAVLPATHVFARNEIEPLQARLMELNDWLGMEVVRLRPYVVETGIAAA